MTRIKKALKRIWGKPRRSAETRSTAKEYYNRYLAYSFHQGDCKDDKQFEACITRLYHTIEKGLAHFHFRAGFGESNIRALISHMEDYARAGYDTTAFFYETALSCLYGYIEKNKPYGWDDAHLEKRISNLPGKPNGLGGAMSFSPPPLGEGQLKTAGFPDFLASRHSMRHFGKEPVEVGRIADAIKLAQYTPSACNRQGWSVKIVTDKELIKEVLSCQNGNKGFGQEFDKLIIVLGDLRAFNSEREVYQVFIDGGMYAMNVLHCLHYEHIASVPLSASLTGEQERNIRSLLHIIDAEVLILLIGVGNYPPDDECLATRSARHEARYELM